MSVDHSYTRVDENSQVGEARRNATRIAEAASLSETDQGRVAIIVTELGNNLVRHAKNGEILIRRVANRSVGGVEIIAVDRGPGMSDVGRCMQDGFSTGGTAGTGLGAIRRLSTEFDVFSAQPGGTVVVARVTKPSPSPTTDQISWSAICVPASGETACGDHFQLMEQEGSLALIVADGLGHGPLAANASQEAVRVFAEQRSQPPGRIIDAAHPVLRSTRGAAVAVAQLNVSGRTLKYAGIGNIAGSIVTSTDNKKLFSHNGTVGLQMHRVQEFDYTWPEKALLIMHSDGLQTRWDLSAYPGLLQRHPGVIAGVLFRDFKRGRDDLTIVVIR